MPWRRRGKDEFSPWRPYPAGIYIAFYTGLVAIAMFVIAILTGDWVTGFAAIIFSAIAVEEVADAAYHAGLRAESHAEKLRRGRYEADR